MAFRADAGNHVPGSAVPPDDVPSRAGSAWGCERIPSKRKVTIVGGGVAALEALLALRSLAGDLVDLEIVAATPEFVYRPLAVAEPFGLGTAHRFDLSRDRSRAGRGAARGRRRPRGARTSIASSRGTGGASTTTCCWWPSGRAPTTAIPGSVSIKGPAYTSRFSTVLRKLDKRHGHPGGVRGARRHILAASALRARPAHRRTRGRARTAQGHAPARHARVGAARALRPDGLRGGARAARPARRGAR